MEWEGGWKDEGWEGGRLEGEGNREGGKRKRKDGEHG